MTPDTIFQLANPLALLGWAALALAPLAPLWTNRLAIGIALALSVLYTAVIAAHFASAPGGFDSLANVMLLFTDPGAALAGWVHFLAFDLFIGAWALRTARAEGIPHVVMLPVLAFTFLLGPIGLAAFFAIRAGQQLRAHPV